MADPTASVRGQPGAIAVRFEVDGSEARQRLDQYLSTKIQRLSRSRVQRVIGRGDVEVNGQVASSAQRVVAGDQVALWRIPPPEPPAGGWPVELTRGPDWVALDKPGNLTVHPTARYFHQTVTAWMERQPEGFDDARLVHRLDRETSGVLLVALGFDADRRLGIAFERKRVRKEYLAIVEGEAPESMRCDGALGADPSSSVIRVKQAVVAGGLEAKTSFRLERHLSSGRSLVRCFPETGRMHQLRAHLAHLGYPIVGDKIYGSAPDEAYDAFCEGGLSDELARLFGASRHLLHAAALEFPEPGGGSQRVVAPLPGDFLDALK